MSKKWKIVINSPVVLGFAAVCFGATLAGMLTGGAATRMLFMTRHTSLLSPMTWVRFITHIFGHSGWGHFMGNMTYILLLGPLLEEKHGSGMTIRVILVTALVTALLSYILFPGTALCGASGVVFAFIILASFTGFSSGEIPLTFLLVAAIFIGQQVVEGVFTRDNISQLSHIAGGLVGACMGFAFGRRR